jgi:transposase
MEQATTIGLDIAKHVFQLHGADAAGHVLFRKRITRVKLLSFLAAQTRCVVAMEAWPARTTGRVKSLSWAIMCA